MPKRERQRHERRLNAIEDVEKSSPGFSRQLLWASEFLRSVLNVFNKVFLCSYNTFYDFIMFLYNFQSYSLLISRIYIYGLGDPDTLSGKK